MPRSSEHSATELGSRKARQRLPFRTSPYYTHIADGLTLGYRRAARGGTWIARRVAQSKLETGATGSGRYEEHSLGSANDAVENVGMNFQQAQDAALLWFKQSALGDSGEVVSGPYTVQQAMEDYLAHSEREKRKVLPDTRTAIRAHILPTLGKIELSKLTHSRVKAWRDAVASSAPRVRTAFVKENRVVAHTLNGVTTLRNRSMATKNLQVQATRTIDPNDADAMRKRQATTNRILSILKAGLNHAHAELNRVSSKSAWDTVKPFRKVDVAKVRFLTMDEIASLISHCPIDLGTLVRAALLTGCRYGELARMRVSDFDADNETIFVPVSKNGESRHIELNAEGCAFFAALCHYRDPTSRTFSKANGKAWKKSEQTRPMNEACAAAKIEQVTFHILRHTYASHLAMNQTPMRVIADQLGHKDTRITERHYAHLGRAFVRETIRTRLPNFGLIENGPVLVSKAS